MKEEYWGHRYHTERKDEPPVRMTKAKRNKVCKVHKGDHVYLLVETGDGTPFFWGSPWFSEWKNQWIGNYQCACGKRKAFGAKAEKKEDLPKVI